MPIKFKCSKCGHEMTVKDELAGKQGKCPACKAVLTVPAPGAASKPAAAAPSRPAPSPPKKVVEEVEEDVVEAEVEEDEPPRKKKGSITEKPAARRRKDEDEEDEDEDEEEDRPKKRKRGITAKLSGSRRRRDDEEEEEEDRQDDEGDEDSGRGRTREARAGWQKARLGVYLNQISMWIYAGVWGLMIAMFFMSCILGAALVTGGAGGASGALTILTLMSYLWYGLWLGLWVTSLIGYIFIIMTPGKNNEKALGITCTSLLGAELIVILIMIITSASILSGGLIGSNADPRAILEGALMLMLLAFLCEVGRNTVFAAYVQAVGRTLKDRKTRESGHGLLILTPILGLSIPLIDYLVLRLMASTAPGPGGGGAGAGVMALIMFFATAGTFLFLTLFYASKLGWAKEAIEDRC